jgi:hypothetical protein
MPPDYAEPLVSRHVFRDAMEFLIGRPLSETELDELLRQLSVRSDNNAELLLNALTNKRIQLVGKKAVSYRGTTYRGDTIFHAILAVKTAMESSRST